MDSLPSIAEEYYEVLDVNELYNSTCSTWTTCTSCVDSFDDACYWCKEPKTGGDPICVGHSIAQDKCKLEDLEATCTEGVGWYVLVLTLSGLLCCCCFLTMARKFVAVWHERRWTASGDDMGRPLLDEDEREEQAHDAVIRGSLVDAAGAPWRCPACGFDNRPLCKLCDLCGISSEFAEAYWRSREESKCKGARGKISLPRIDDGKVGAKPRSPGSMAGVAEDVEVEHAQNDEVAEDAKQSSEEMIRERGKDGDEQESDPDLESTPLLQVAALVVSEAARAESTQEGDSDGRESGDQDGAEGTSAEDDINKPRASTFQLPPSVTLTERQKRARRRRIWQRISAPEGRARWVHSLHSPAVAPSGVPAPLLAHPSAAAAAALGVGVGVGQTSMPPLTSSSISAVFRYWNSSRSQLSQLPLPDAQELPASMTEDSKGGEIGPALAIAVAALSPVSEPEEVSGEDVLSSLERGDGQLESRASEQGQVQLATALSYIQERSRTPYICDVEEKGGGGEERGYKGSSLVVSLGAEALGKSEERKIKRSDSFGDDGMQQQYPAYYVTFLEGGGLAWDEAREGEIIVRPNSPPPSAKRRGPSAGEGTTSDAEGLGTSPISRRPAWGDAGARQRGSRQEENRRELWASAKRMDVHGLCEISMLPFWQKHSWFLDQLRLLQIPHGAGMEAMRIEVHRNNLLEDSFAQVSAMNTGELRRWLRVQFVGEPGVDAGGLEREWFLLVCRALFDPSTGLFKPQRADGAFTINPSSGVANEMHLEYFRFTGRVLGKLLMEHSVAPYHLALPILKHLLSLPFAFSDLEFCDAELYKNLTWMKGNEGAGALGLDFTVTQESFGINQVVELMPGGKDTAVTDSNKEDFLKLRLKHCVLESIHDQLWNLLRGFYDVIPAQLISVFDYQELELLLCGIPEIDVMEWRRHSRYLGDYRRSGENHTVVKWFWEVVKDFSEEDKSRFLQFCTGTSRLPPHGFKALQSNDGSFRAFSVQSITKRESAFPRAHTCFNKLDLPVYDTKKELEECLRLCICFELTGFTID